MTGKIFGYGIPESGHACPFRSQNVQIQIVSDHQAFFRAEAGFPDAKIKKCPFRFFRSHFFTDYNEHLKFINSSEYQPIYS